MYPYGALNSCRKLEKSNELSLRYLKTNPHKDTYMDTQTRVITKEGPLLVNPGSKIRVPFPPFSLILNLQREFYVLVTESSMY